MKAIRTQATRDAHRITKHKRGNPHGIGAGHPSPGIMPGGYGGMIGSNVEDEASGSADDAAESTAGTS